MTSLSSVSRVLALAAILHSPLVGQSSRAWKPAVYHDLVVGKSTRQDVLQKLGKPKYVGKEQDTGEPIMSYGVTDPLRGDLTVYVRGGILRGITLTPAEIVSKAEMVKKFGRDYLDVHYSSDECLSEGGTAPLYEDASGAYERIEYRPRGLSVVLDDDGVQAIIFEGPPFPATRSRCSPRRGNNRMHP